MHLIETTVWIMPDLADFLSSEVERTSYRTVEEKTGVSRGALENLIKRQNKQPPKLETLKAISEAYGLALWRVLEMAGYDPGWDKESNPEQSRLLALISQDPEMEPLLKELLELPPRSRRLALRAAATYLKMAAEDQNDDQEKF